MKQPDKFRILFVCMGNICRSPAGECVLRHLADAAGEGDQLECDSAGTIDLHTGNPPDARMRAAARNRGIAVGGSARQIAAEDLDRFDLILTMDAENRAYVESLQTRVGGRAEVRNFCDLCREHGEYSEVPDPYYGGGDGFELVLDLLQDGCGSLLDDIREGRQRDRLP